MFILQKNEVFAERYLLKELIGSRGISEVWVTEDLQADREVVALKIFTTTSRLDNITLEHLQEDFDAINTLHHPHLLHFKRFETYQGSPYLVMPYVKQGSLNQWLHEIGPLPEAEVAKMLQQVAGALAYLHQQQPVVLHQAITPDNILITNEGDYMLANPGVRSRTRHALYRAIGQNFVSHTAHTPPELFAAQATYNSAGDIFSLGVTLYEACTRQVPWAGNGGLSLLQGAAVPHLPSSYSPVLNNLVRACLDPNWKSRPTAEELEAEAAYFLQNGAWKMYGKFGPVTAKFLVPEKRSPYKVIMFSALVLVALLAVAYWGFRENWFTGNAEDKVVATVLENSEPADTSRTSIKELSEPVAEEPVKRETPDKKIVQEPVQTEAKKPVVAPPVKTTPVTLATPPQTSKPKEKGTARPGDLKSYLNQLHNQQVPFDVREGWRGDVLRYFAPDATVHYTADNVVVGTLAPGEFLDILLSADSTLTTLSIDSSREDETGKTARLYVRSFSSQ
jgi:serine/threonine-protein kinase